jgi:filamentous hemagglutinin family protein
MMQFLFKRLLILVLLGKATVAMAAGDLPTGAIVVSGQATINAQSQQLNIKQTTDRAIVNWQDFSIGHDHSVNITQPTSQSAILNRVTSLTPSTIAGQLNANGQVFLVNPNGIAITPTGIVNVGGGFLASTLNISNDDFNAGKLNFYGNASGAAISNAGEISATQEGFIVLLGNRISHSGSISVPLGKVFIGSAEQATLDFNGDGLLQVAIPTQSNTGQPLIDVAGNIVASGGRIEIKAATAQNVIRDAVHISGHLSASSAYLKGGVIVLEGGEGGKTTLTDGAHIEANSQQAKGGVVTLTGHTLQIQDAQINTNGATGGGTLLVGGDYQGGGTLKHAANISVAAGAALNANATVDGAGGQVVLWSDETTQFLGNISAQGAGSGKGGLAEVSSHGLLDFSGWVDLRAASGLTGDLLLDPYNVTISSGADANHTAFTATGNSSIINVSTLQTALASANVNVSTGSSGAQSGDITVSNALTWASGNTLTLIAARDITQNAAITATNGGGLTYTAGRDININQNITASAGALDVSLSAVKNITLNTATISTAGGTFTAAANSSDGNTALTLFDTTISVGAGSATLSGTNTSSGNGVDLYDNVSLSSTSASGITISGTTNTGDGVDLVSATLTAAGNVTLQGSTATSNTLYDGIFFSGDNTIANNGSGTLSLTGTASNLGDGIYVGSGTLSLSNASTGAISLTGSNTNATVNTTGYYGLHIDSNAILNTAGTVALNGSVVNGYGAGVFFYDTTMTSDGTTAITGAGSGTVARGVQIEMGNTFTLNGGSLTVSGTSAGDAGLQLRNTSTYNRNSGILSMSGTSAAYRGIDIFSSASVVFNGDATLNGVSTSGSGIYMGNVLTTNSGDVAMIGSSTSGYGISFNNTTTLSNTGAGSISFAGTSSSNSGFKLSSNIAVSTAGNMSLSGTSDGGTGVSVLSGASVTQSSGNLSLAGSTTSGTGVSLAATSTVTNNGAGSLTFNGTHDITVAGSVSSSNGALSLLTTGDLTIASTGSVSGASPVLSATGAFINNKGSNAVTATSGRWLIYSNNPSDNTFGSLDSGNYAIWSNTYTGLPPASVTETGNRYIFAYQPTLNVTTTDASKTYGDAISGDLANNYTISGLNAGVSNAYLADASSNTYTGTPTITSSESVATTSVGTGDVVASAGTLTTLNDYAVSFNNIGVLTVNPKNLMITADNHVKPYGSQLSFSGAAFNSNGLVNNDSISDVQLTSLGSAASASVGDYNILATNASGVGLSNYAISYETGLLTVTKPVTTLIPSLPTCNLLVDCGGNASRSAGVNSLKPVYLVNALNDTQLDNVLINNLTKH